MKRDELVKALYVGLISDLCNTYPSDKRSLERDLHRLIKNVEKLSHYFYCLEMPAIAAGLRDGMERKSIRPVHGLNHCKLAKGTVYPRLFQSLWCRIFDGTGDIMSCPDTTAIFYLSELLLAFKKIEGGCDSSKEQIVVQEFVNQESRIRPPTLHWNVGSFQPDGSIHLNGDVDCSRDGYSDDLFPSTGRDVIDPRLAETLQRVADCFSGSLSEFNPESEQCRHGPGAVADMARGGDKYSFSTWPERLDALFPYDAHATIGLDIPDYVDHEHPARLICVPKDARAPRLIAAEPSYLQFAQQSLNAYLRNETRNSCIRASITFNDQRPSQEWALCSSIDREMATVDLKSASDLLSLWLIERIFRRNPSILHAIYHTRSRYVTDGVNTLFMRKVAPMGNAYIFPLQTIVYTLMGIAALHVIDRKSSVSLKSIRKYSREVRVFGDDIILPTRAYGYLVGLLTYSGLVVNTSKSFSEGNFRESCGVDAYSGVNVTPVYVKAVPDSDSPESIVSTVETINNLKMRGLWHTAEALKSLIPSRIRNKIPQVRRGSGAFGFQALLPEPPSVKVRFNPHLQHLEALCLTPISKVRNIRPEGIRNLLQYVTERPSLLTEWESGIKIPLDLKLWSRWVPLRDLAGQYA